MTGKRVFTALALTALLVCGIAPSASGTATTNIQVDSEKVSGVIIQYAEGVNPIAKNGEPTGANLLRGQITSEDLGGGLYALNFVD